MLRSHHQKTGFIPKNGWRVKTSKIFSDPKQTRTNRYESNITKLGSESENSDSLEPINRLYSVRRATLTERLKKNQEEDEEIQNTIKVHFDEKAPKHQD